MTKQQLIQDFEARCVTIAEDVEAVLKRGVPRFRGMLATRGAVGTTTYLIHAHKPSDTFTDLWAVGHLEHTVEAVILLEAKWDRLFMDEDRRAARERLQEHEWSPELRSAVRPT